jgi:prophage regulatory protein
MDEVDRFVREDERAKITGLSRSAWFAAERAGRAPRRVRLGPNAVGWRLSELMAWMATRETGGAPAPAAALAARGVAGDQTAA